MNFLIKFENSVYCSDYLSYTHTYAVLSLTRLLQSSKPIWIEHSTCKPQKKHQSLS